MAPNETVQLRKFALRSTAKTGKPTTVVAANPHDAVYKGHHEILPEALWNVHYDKETSTKDKSQFEVQTHSGTYKVSVEEIA